MNLMQLIKYLQSQGIGSKKQCLQWLKEEAIVLNGITATSPNEDIAPETIQTLQLHDEFITLIPVPFFYLLLHKPADYETSHQPWSHYPSIFSLLTENLRNLKPQAVGRLDADTTGVLLMTNDGQFNHRMTSPRHNIQKIYQVKLKHNAERALCQKLISGVVLRDSPEPVKAISAELTQPDILILTINEGRYHQVKRMVSAAGNRVETLHRICFAGFELDGLKAGEWRWIHPDQK